MLSQCAEDDDECVADGIMVVVPESRRRRALVFDCDPVHRCKLRDFAGEHLRVYRSALTERGINHPDLFKTLDSILK